MVLLKSYECKCSPIGAFYRPPYAKETSLRDLAFSLLSIKNMQNNTYIYWWRLSLPYIYVKKSMKFGSNQLIRHQLLFDMAQ